MMRHRHGSIAPQSGRRQAGFSMFELIVYLLVSSILFATLVNRYREFPGEAERANFTAILAQMRTGVNLQMMDMIASADFGRGEELAGSNPMDLMLQTPSNYVGSFASVDINTMPRRVWYFDRSRGELVYLADNAANLYVERNGISQSDAHIRFRITDMRAADAPAGQGWQGLTLAPVEPYQWRQAPIDIQAIAESNTQPEGG